MKLKFTLLLLLLSAVSALAEFTYEGLKYEINNDKDLSVTLLGSVSSNITSLKIPERVNNDIWTYEVTRIADNAFANSKITGEVRLPDTVTRIGASAFKGCTGITELNVTKHVEYIGDDAFNGCTAVKYLYLGCTPEYERSGRHQYSYAFSGLGSKADHLMVQIGPEVKKIEYRLFSSANVTELFFTAGSKCEVIGDYAFAERPLAGELNLPESIKTIGGYAFYQTHLTSITVPQGVTSIGDLAFDGIEELNAVNWNAEAPQAGQDLFASYMGKVPVFDVTFGPEVRVIPNGLFNFSDEKRYGAGVRSITWPEQSKIEEIGSMAFAGNVKLTGDLSLPKSVRKLGDSAFQACQGLTSAALGSNIEQLGYLVFEGCDAIREFYYDVLNGAAALWSAENSDTELRVHIGPNVKVIPQNFMLYVSQWPSKIFLSEATSLESIEQSAFYGERVKFDNLLFHDGLKTINWEAFYGNIEADVRIPASLEPPVMGTLSNIHATSLAWASNTLQNLSGMSVDGSVTIESNVTTIAPDLFARQNINRFVIEDSEQPLKFNDEASKTGGQLKNITELYLGRNLSYDFSPFKDFERLDKVTLSEHCTALPANLFAGAEDCVFTNLVVESATPPAADEKAFVNVDYAKCKLEVPAGSESTYAAAPVWRNFFSAAIDEVEVDAPAVVYDLRGVKVEGPLPSGIYIIRQSGHSRKIRL